MSHTNDRLPERLRHLLVAEGWAEDLAMEDAGIILFTHPDHPRRQLSLPMDTVTYTDWRELCDRTVEKLAEMTDRDRDAIRKLVLPMRTEASGSRTRAWATFLLWAAIGYGLAVGGNYLWQRATAPAPVSLSLAGCMDRNAADSAAAMSEDAGLDLSEFPADRAYSYLRFRALQVSASAAEMRRCYLDAQGLSSAFDADGLIGADMDVIEEAVSDVYSLMGARVATAPFGAGGVMAVPVGPPTADARDAANRISIRLSALAEDLI